MTTSAAESRKAARARRRAERQAARERRRAERQSKSQSKKVAPTGGATPDDPRTTQVTMPAEALRRRRAFTLIEQTHTGLVATRETVVLSLFAAAPGTDAYDDLTREVEALNDEIDDLRELSDELLRQLQPLALADQRLAELEQMVAATQALSHASQRAQALLSAARDLLMALDDALDGDGA